MQNKPTQTERMTDSQLAVLPILSLAYLGDAVFEVMVREHLVRCGSYQPSALNVKALGYVTATAQSGAIERLLAMLTPAEADIYRRGRNAKHRRASPRTNTPQYRAATGLECVFGYLKLTCQTERLEELFGAITG